MFGPSCPTTTKILKDVTIQAFWDVMPYLLDVSKDRSTFNSAWLLVLRMKAVLSFETSLSIHQSTRIVPPHETWILNTTMTASNPDKRWEIVLPYHKFTAQRQWYLPTIPIFWGGGGVVTVGVYGGREVWTWTCVPSARNLLQGLRKTSMSCAFGFMEFLKWWRKCGE